MPAAAASPGERALAARLKAVLKGARYAHTRGVVKTAKALALRHGVSPKRAAIAAWLHDCAKALDRDAMKRLLRHAGVDRDERALPALWHAPVGAYLARRDYGVGDAEILGAIRWHTTGFKGQTPLQKVVFVSDYIEPGRPRWPELPALRRLAGRDLDAAWAQVLKHKLLDLVGRGRPLHPRSLAAYNRALEHA
jgi:predicted HD superfamily hydrolase involved in NAD metabolism